MSSVRKTSLECACNINVYLTEIQEQECSLRCWTGAECHNAKLLVSARVGYLCAVGGHLPVEGVTVFGIVTCIYVCVCSYNGIMVGIAGSL